MSRKVENLWHALEADAVLSALRTDSARGLSLKEAAVRRMKLGENAVWSVRRTSLWEMASGEFADLSAVLLVITALLSAVFNESDDAVVLIGILAVSAAIRTAVSVLVHRIFEDAARTNIPHASVVRGGKLRVLPADAVVPGDILLLETGTPVVADVRILSGEVVVTELGVTDNRDPQRKSPAYVLPGDTLCEERINILFAGSTVVSGSGRGVVVASGEKTYIFARRGHIRVPAGEDLPILNRLSVWSRTVSLVMIAAVLLISLGGMFWGQSGLPLDTLFLSALAVAVASMSEFLGVIAAILLARSMQHLRRDSDGGTVIRTADSVERFADSRCIVLSDPRLLRSGKIRLQNLFYKGEDLSDDVNCGAAVHLLALSMLCRCGSLHPVSSGTDSAFRCELTEKIYALLQSCGETLSADTELPPVVETSRNDRLYTALTSSPEGAVAYVCGSLSDVLSCCSTIETGGASAVLTPQIREQLLSQARLCESASMSTVCIAKRLSPYTTLSRPSALQTKMTLMGYYAVVDPVEADLALLIEKCKAGGIRVVVLTESDREVCLPAVEAGIVPPRSYVCSDPDQIERYFAEEAPSSDFGGNFCVFVRDRAAREMILRKITEYVPECVYVGDSLPDIPLFGIPSVSVASARHFAKSPQCVFSAADASVQLDSPRRSAGAADTIRIIASCKGAFLRLRGITEYLLSVQTLRLVVMIAAALFSVPMLSPVQILWWGMILDLMAVLTFSFSRRDNEALTLSSDAIRLPSLRRGFWFPVISGMLAGILLSLSSALSVKILPLSDPEPVIYMGGLLSSAFFLVSVRVGEKKRSVSVNTVGILYVILLSVTIVITLLNEDLRVCLFAVLPALTVPVLRFVYRYVGRDMMRGADDLGETRRFFSIK